MATIYKIFSVQVIATLVFILATAANYCAAQDPNTVISEQNPLSPDRNEEILKKSDSEKKGKKVDPSKLELYGTIILGDKKNALIYDNSKQQTDTDQQQEKNKKAGVYSLGDSIGGYVISAIEEKRVVLDYYGEKVTLTLREGKEPPQGDVTPLEEKSEPPAPEQQKPGMKAEPREKQDREKPGSVPKTVVNSPIMSQEEAEEIVEFSKEIFDDIQKGGEGVDQGAIEEKKEELKRRLLEKLEEAQQMDKQVR